MTVTPRAMQRPAGRSQKPNGCWVTRWAGAGHGGTTYPANLRLFMNSLTQDQWVQFSTSFQSHPPMPWWLLHDMNRPDRKALYAYVRWLGPAGGPAPSFVPPDQEPVGAVVQFPAPPNK
jgi:hypothetical protein